MLIWGKLRAFSVGHLKRRESYWNVWCKASWSMITIGHVDISNGVIGQVICARPIWNYEPDYLWTVRHHAVLKFLPFVFQTDANSLFWGRVFFFTNFDWLSRVTKKKYTGQWHLLLDFPWQFKWLVWSVRLQVLGNRIGQIGHFWSCNSKIIGNKCELFRTNHVLAFCCYHIYTVISSKNSILDSIFCL